MGPGPGGGGGGGPGGGGAGGYTGGYAPVPNLAPAPPGYALVAPPPSYAPAMTLASSPARAALVSPAHPSLLHWQGSVPPPPPPPPTSMPMPMPMPMPTTPGGNPYLNASGRDIMAVGAPPPLPSFTHVYKDAITSLSRELGEASQRLTNAAAAATEAQRAGARK